MRLVIEILAGLGPALTALFAFLGLRTWKKKLWGENKFTLSNDCIKELYLLIEEFRNYRNPFYPAGEMYNASYEYYEQNPNDEFDTNTANKLAEIKRWNRLVDQFEVFKSALLKFKVLVNNFDFDYFEDENMELFVKAINTSRIMKESYDRQDKTIRQKSKKEQDEFYKDALINRKTLSYSGPEDQFSMDLDLYFKKFNKRIRKFNFR